MLSSNILVATCLAYAALLFGIAFWAERRARAGQLNWLRSPLVYTLSLSVYCTGWTFYGAVGTAARGGLEYLTIYLGPSLVFFGWWWLLRKLVRIGHTQRITSIADLLSSRYGKSTFLGALVTVLAVIGSTPYIALQLQSLSLSFSVFTAFSNPEPLRAAADVTAFWLAAGLALFTIFFGTRNVDANEQHHGVVTAIAVEAIVKLLALLVVGLFVVTQLGAETRLFSPERLAALQTETLFGPRWVTMTFLAASAIICLPRMFQVLVVENADEGHLYTAAWAFPLYLCLISLFVLPIALTGQALLPDTANPDLYVLTIPLSQGQETVALLAFLGGFSAATSMVIVAAIALSTMISNHIVLPIWLSLNPTRTQTSGDVRNVLLTSRRLSIAVVLALGYLYFRITGGSAALASIGLISFAGVAQVLPALLGGLFWHGATRTGALAGIVAGFAIWAYTLFLPSFEGNFLISSAVLADGPFGITALRPQSLFGLGGTDPLVHSVFWSLSLNAVIFITLSLASTQRPLERLQANSFVDAFRDPDATGLTLTRSATAEDLFTLAQRILGAGQAHEMFARVAEAQGKSTGLPDATDLLITGLERELTGSVGSAAAHAMVAQITSGGQVSVDELIRMADETAQIVEYSQELERKSGQLTRTASELRAANARLTRLSEQKDAFLSQVSHELRTPMTSIRSFAEILRQNADIDTPDARRFLGIIHEESQRLTRLLDEILDLSVLESGQVKLDLAPIRLGDVVDAAISATEGLRTAQGVQIKVARAQMDATVTADHDRLAQVLINLISNAVKYGTAEIPVIRITAARAGPHITLTIADNGPGIAAEDRARAFEKFSRLGEMTLAGSAGLGLPISREIMRALGGDLTIEPAARGATFRLTLHPSEAARTVAE